MTPGARIQAAIELLAAIQASPQPADGVASTYFRTHRYIGAKDRKAIGDRVWRLLRRRARLGWWASHAAARALDRRPGHAAQPSTSTSPGAALDEARRLMLADLVLAQGMTQDGLDGLREEPYGVPGLTQDERRIVAAMTGQPLEHSAMPRWVRHEYPEWLEATLTRRFGAAMADEVAALNIEAPLDLRVNTLKVTRDVAITRLAAEGIAASVTPWSPLGLRLGVRIGLGSSPAFRDGLVEVQDEGSQMVALLADARPGQAVLDYCAGAGGKTLALAAAMANKGRLVACDVSEGRMERSAVRLKRAGVHNVTRRVLDDTSGKWLKRAQGSYDRVLVDAPCSGTGTWRRNPDAKWRLSPDDVAELVALQRRILDTAARLVRPGGRLIYATCSLLPDENEDQISRFLADTPAFHGLPVATVWQAAMGTPWPLGEAEALRLTPASTGTDGYFVVVLERDTGGGQISEDS
ncbi:MAG: RsmB/NOP family class I SAM-dependent RNA methyltransferase [Alphaproteobacteria bacterium]|nr:RsmB/NOP family class I SAM-dependent RNA methyltransferase [Alphaproteobacteria bacterium]